MRSKVKGSKSGRRRHGKRGHGKKRTWKKEDMEKEDMKKQVEEESMKVGLRREDALCRSKWSVDVNQIAAGLR